MTSTKLALLLFALTSALAACGDPVLDAERDAIGPDLTREPNGPLHHPGKPCLVCHDGTGPASMVFATAGTVFQDATDPTPLVGATVVLTDQTMNTITAQTNCSGNFFVQQVDFNLTWPVHIEVLYGSQSASMVSHQARTTSCAQCHTGTTSSSSVQQVYLNTAPMNYPASGCP